MPKRDVVLQRRFEGGRVVALIEVRCASGRVDEVHERAKRKVGIGAAGDLGEHVEADLGRSRAGVDPGGVDESQAGETRLPTVEVAAGHGPTLPAGARPRPGRWH